MDFELHDQEIQRMNSIEHEFHAVGSRTQFQCSNEFGERDECLLDIVIRSRWLHTMIQNHVDCNAIASCMESRIREFGKFRQNADTVWVRYYPLDLMDNSS